MISWLFEKIINPIIGIIGGLIGMGVIVLIIYSITDLEEYYRNKEWRLCFVRLLLYIILILVIGKIAMILLNGYGYYLEEDF